MSKKRGFTLIELMIVIAIIAILAAILFPVFKKAQMKAQQVACMSNVRQLLTAIKMYAQDNDDEVPYALYGDLARSAWADVIFQGYVSNDQVFDCPASALHMDRLTGMNLYQSRFIREDEGYAGVGYSYGINAMPANPTWNPSYPTGGPAGAKQGLVEDASGTILIADAGFNTANTTAYVIYRDLDDNYLTLDGDYDPEHLKWELDVSRHGQYGKFNAGFCDGHAKFIDYQQTIDPVQNINMWTTARYD